MFFASVFVPRRPEVDAGAASSLLALAQDFSPRVEVHAPHLVTLDVSGLGSLLGPPRTIGEELRRSAADRGLFVHVAVCASRAAAVVLACARPGLTVIDPGGEADALAPLPLRALEAGVSFVCADETPQRRGERREAIGSRAGAGGAAARRRMGPRAPVVDAGAWPATHPALECLHTFRRWGLKTLGDVAALPADAVAARMGAPGVAWHRLASGADPRPLVPSTPGEVFEETLELEWPIEGLEPLSFVLGRLCDPLCAHLEQRDRGVAALHVRLRLVTREIHARRLELPAPIRDARALRTLALLDLESHPPPAAIDAVTIAADPTPGRVLQYSLLARALPAAERVSTLLARLTALMGEGLSGSPRLVDSHRPGAFEMTAFSIAGRAARVSGPERRALVEPVDGRARSGQGPGPDAVRSVLRRFRHPIAARVIVEDGRPVRVTTDRRGFAGGRVTSCAGPWRTSGEWWHVRSAEWNVPSAEGSPSVAGRVPESRGWVAKTRSGYGVYGSVVPTGHGAIATPELRSPGFGGVRGAILPDPATVAHDREAQAEHIYALNFLVRDAPAAMRRARAPHSGPLLAKPRGAPPWNCDEWDVELTDGAAYRLVRDRDTDRWYVSGIVD